MSSTAPSELHWRIPTTGDPAQLRLSLAQVGLATIVAALILLVAAPREWLGWALAGLIPLAIYVAYRRWTRFQRSLVGPENVWIDERGLHWIDAAGREQLFQRGDVTGFRLGREADTLRAIPALTLYLRGGFESQPIELYPPATPEAVRRLLTERWALTERENAGETVATPRYDAAIHVYSECHEENRQWHWEGTHGELAELFAQFCIAAAQLPLPPPGAKPAERIVLAQRRAPVRLRLAHAPQPHLEHDTIAAPAAVLCQIAERTAALLDNAAVPSDASFDVVLGPKDVWTFHLHVREP